MNPSMLPLHTSQFGRADLVRVLALADPRIRQMALSVIADRLEPKAEELDLGEIATAPPGPTALDEDAGEIVELAPVPFWRAHHFELVAPDIAPEPPKANEPTSEQKQVALLPPETAALASKAEVLTALRKSSTVTRMSRELHIDKIVDRISRCERLERLPRRRRPSWGSELHLIQDRSTRLTPYWWDQDRVFEWVSRVYPRNAVTLLRNRDENLAFWTVAPQYSRHYALPAPGTPVILLSDLGSLAEQGQQVQQFWQDWGQRYLDNHNPALALVPTNVSNVPSELRKVWSIVPWGTLPCPSGEQPVAPEETLERLLALIAPAVRLEPGLLRAIRCLLPEGRADPGWEARIWQHQAISSPHCVAATLDRQFQEQFRQKFAIQAPDLQKAVLDLVHQWHSPISRMIWAETIVNLPRDSQERLKDGVLEHAIDLFTQFSTERCREPLGISTAAWASRMVDRSWNSRVRDRRLSKALNSIYECVRPREAVSQAPRWSDPGHNSPVADKEFQVVVRQSGDQMVFERVPEESPSVWDPNRVGSPLAALRTRNGLIKLSELGDDDLSARFWKSGHPPAWASAWGHDDHGAWAEFQVGKATQRMRWIVPGRFQMGSPESEEGRYDDEGPVHDVEISRGYWLFETPCCQELWEAVFGVEANKSAFRGGRRPVENISWEEVVRFTKNIIEKVPGLELRLPREAEWEYACRAGNQAPRFAELEEAAWYRKNSGGKTHEVGQKLANAWGLYDMLGNVWEWCLDGSREYTRQPVTDPDGGGGARRVFRGGCWFFDARSVRAAFRYAYHAGYRSNDLGFRGLSSGDEPAQAKGTRSVTKRKAEPASAPEAQIFEISDRDLLSVKMPLFARFELATDSERVTFDRLTKPAWADAVGRDCFGMWAEIRLGEVKQRLRWIMPGRFRMGSPDEEEGRLDWEGPVHEVIISRGYWLFDTPCCQELWEAVLGADANKSGFRGGRRPVETVDWHDAVRFSKELNKLKKGLNLRLPREAEWEYACRAGTAGSRYGKLEEVAWYDGNSGKVTHDVGQLVANAWGLHDMLGNVWEWCLDGQRDYTEASLTDPDGGGAGRVFRGGGWSGVARGVRAAYRGAILAGFRGDVLGFRCLSSEMEEEGAEQVEQGRSGAKQSEGGAEQASPASARKPGLFGKIVSTLREVFAGDESKSTKPKKKK